MAEQLVQIERSGGAVTHLVLNRPEKRNALNIPLLEQLVAALDIVASQNDTRVLVLRGNGPVFCAGLDLAEGLDEQRAHASAELIARALNAIAAQTCVTIAAVHGAAIAGGAGLMSACDLVVASEETVIGYPEVRRGLVAAIVMTFIRRRMREADARELLLLGENVIASVARDMGLVNKVVPPDQVMTVVETWIGKALKGSPEAIARSKAFWNGLAPHAVSADIQKALDLHKAVRTSAAAQEGMLAFVEKRLPAWDPDRN